MPRTLYLLLAGCLFLIPAFFRSRYALGMVAWDICVLVAAIVDGARLPAPPAIDVRREWLGAPSLGREVEVEVAVTQHSRSLLHCTLLDDLPAPFLDEPARYHVDAYPEAHAAVRYTFIPAQRGDHTTGRLYLLYRSNVGLVERWARADLTQTVRIYPTLRTTEENRLYLARHHRIELQMRMRRQRGMGRDFESLRDYLEGDETRDICWTASARRGALVTRIYEMEKSQAVWLVLDAGRLQGARVGRYTKAGPGDRRRAWRWRRSRLRREIVLDCLLTDATRSSSYFPVEESPICVRCSLILSRGVLSRSKQTICVPRRR